MIFLFSKLFSRLLAFADSLLYWPEKSEKWNEKTMKKSTVLLMKAMKIANYTVYDEGCFFAKFTNF